METVLETVGTGVVVVDADGSSPRQRRGLPPPRRPGRAAWSGRDWAQALAGPGRSDVVALVRRLLAGRVARQEREITLPGEGRDRTWR